MSSSTQRVTMPSEINSIDPAVAPSVLLTTVEGRPLYMRPLMKMCDGASTCVTV